MRIHTVEQRENRDEIGQELAIGEIGMRISCITRGGIVMRLAELANGIRMRMRC
jgi:hypothetical protein